MASITLIACARTSAIRDNAAAMGDAHLANAPAPAGSGKSALVYPGTDGKLVYKPWNDRGDTVLDFSNCGYGGGGVALPRVPVKITLSPAGGEEDELGRLQSAIEQIAGLPPDANGFRGTLLLKKGKYRLSAPLNIKASGIVLRGEGSEEVGTLLYGTGRKQYSLIEVDGSGGLEEVKGSMRVITDAYVPVGARTFTVDKPAELKPGDLLIVRRASNDEWIHFIGMDRIVPRSSDPSSTKQWKPFDLNFDRVITKVEGNKVTIDAPIACAIDAKWGGGKMFLASDAGRIEKIGIENLRGECVYDASKKAKEGGKEYLNDEDHANYIVSFSNVKNAWARDLKARYLGHGIVNMERGSKWITVQDCSSVDPINIITGGRRYPYNISGQLCLVQRCYARDARHAFVVGGGQICGPNAFLDCVAENNHATSEPHQRWSVGGLYDNIDAEMAFQDRQWMGSGHGWSGANYVVWNGKGTVVSQQPPTAQNFVIGFAGKKVKGAFDRPDGWWESAGTPVAPRSLYLQQLQDRLGAQAVKNIEK